MKKGRIPQVFNTETSLQLLDIPRYSDRAYKHHMSNLAQEGERNTMLYRKRQRGIPQCQASPEPLPLKSIAMFPFPTWEELKKNVHHFQERYPETQLKKNYKTVSRANSLHQPTQITLKVAGITFSGRQNSDRNIETPENTLYGLWIHIIIKDGYS